MSIGHIAQIRGAVLKFFVGKKCPFMSLPNAGYNF